MGEPTCAARAAARITANILTSAVSSGGKRPKACETMQLAAAQTFGPSNSIAPSAPSSPRSIRSPPVKELARPPPASDSIRIVAGLRSCAASNSIPSPDSSGSICCDNSSESQILAALVRTLFVTATSVSASTFIRSPLHPHFIRPCSSPAPGRCHSRPVGLTDRLQSGYQPEGEPKLKKAGQRSQLSSERRKLGDENPQIATAPNERANSG